jgi:hypothetical protein
VLLQERQRGLTVLGGVDFVAVAAELRGEDPTEVGLVVDDQDLFFGG